MTPKEKAKELVEKYQFNGDMIDDVRMSEESAVECALICVEEIIINGGTKNVIQYELNCFTNKVDYWKEVKQEINKL